ncbi:hypothetical protein ACA910_019525 [Epithemia clementina (nom. ined.)]
MILFLSFCWLSLKDASSFSTRTTLTTTTKAFVSPLCRSRRPRQEPSFPTVALHLSSSSSTSSLNDRDDVVLQTVDQAFEQRDIPGAYSILHDLYQQDSTQHNNVANQEPLLWRYVKAHYEMYDWAVANQQPQSQQEAFVRSGLELASTGLTQFPNSGYLLKWKAILLGKLGNFISTKEKMQNSFEIRDLLLQAQENLSSSSWTPDASIQQALGEWCFKVASIGMMERNVAKLLFGTPPQSSYQEALDHFQKAFALQPKNAAVVATKIADTYDQMNQKELALEWKTKAAHLAAETATTD